MRKPIILSSLFLVGGLFLSLAQATQLDNLEVCPNPNVPKNATINPLAPREVPAYEVLEVGYTCKVTTVETRPGKNEGYKSTGDVQWTLVKKDGGKQIWAAHTVRWGPVYVGYVEPGYHNFSEAKWVCNKKEDIELDGLSRRIQMTLPEIGFGKTDINNPLNFELLKYLNYTSVIPNEDRIWLFWSRTPDIYNKAWAFNPVSGFDDDDSQLDNNSVRCVGRDNTLEDQAPLFEWVEPRFN